MLSLLSDIKEFFALIVSLGWWIAFGAMLTVFAAVLRPWIGFPGVAIGGAVAMFLAVSSGWLADDSKKVEQLQRELKWEQAKRAEIEATNDALYKFLKEESDANEANAETLSKLEKQIDAMPDNPDCGVGKEFTDELKKLR